MVWKYHQSCGKENRFEISHMTGCCGPALWYCYPIIRWQRLCGCVCVPQNLLNPQKLDPLFDKLTTPLKFNSSPFQNDGTGRPSGFTFGAKGKIFRGDISLNFQGVSSISMEDPIFQ